MWFLENKDGVHVSHECIDCTLCGDSIELLLPFEDITVMRVVPAQKITCLRCRAHLAWCVKVLAKEEAAEAEKGGS